MTVYNYTIRTNHPLELIHIDKYIESAIAKDGLKNGMALVFCPHTTAGISLNENCDPDVRRDLISAFNTISPRDESYLHLEGNSHAHFLASLIGPSKSLIIQDGRLLLGSWQGVYFCEFDGPRQRKIHIKILAD